MLQSQCPRASVVGALLLLMTLASCSFTQRAETQLSFCQLYEPLRLSDLTKEFLDTDDFQVSADRKSMADNNRVYRCLCTNSQEGCGVT